MAYMSTFIPVTYFIAYVLTAIQQDSKVIIYYRHQMVSFETIVLLSLECTALASCQDILLP